jgi:hypothetical protein
LPKIDNDSILLSVGIIKQIELGALTFLVSLFVLSPIALAQTITQGYDIETNVSLQRGMVVGLKENEPKKVEPINNSAIRRLHGVVVGTGDSSFVLAEDSQKIFVASGGKFDVLVSDQNGKINPGDYVTVSPVTGIAMKSDEFQETVLGKAIDAFDGTNKKLSDATIKDALGNDKKINIGRIQVDIAIVRNPFLKSTASLPGFLKDASQYVAGKPVNPIRVYLSIAVLFSAAAVAATLIYSGIRSGMVAIGRNPLSKKSILRGIFQVIIVGLIIFIIGIFGVYLLLKL